MKNYLTTGEFANLCKVKKQTLFHYDHIDILKPEFVGENGYRYYSYRQLEEFAMISMLRDLEMPLSEIKKYLDSRSPKNFIKLMEKEAKEAKKKLEEIKWAQKYIARKLELTQNALNMNLGKILIETCPKEFFLITEYKGEENSEFLSTAMMEHLNYCHENNIYSPYAIGGMVQISDLKNEKYKYSHFFTRLDEDEELHNYIKPKGKYLVCYDNNGYHNLKNMAENLLQYAKEQKYEVRDFFYEDVILDELSGKNSDSYMVKLSVGIKIKRNVKNVKK